MKFRTNVILSLVVHAAIISAAFIVIGRTSALHVPAASVTISIVTGLADIKPLLKLEKTKQAIHDHRATVHVSAAKAAERAHPSTEDNEAPQSIRDDQVRNSFKGRNSGEENQKKSEGLTVGLSGLFQGDEDHSYPSATEHQNLSGSIATLKNTVHEQAEISSGNEHTENVAITIRAAIEKALIYPQLAKKRGLEGTAITEFTVNKKGNPENIRIIKSTGYSILDTAAKDTVIRAAPFSVTGSRDRTPYEIPITYRLKKG